MNVVTNEARKEVIEDIDDGMGLEELEEKYDEPESIARLSTEEDLFSIMGSGKIELNPKAYVYLDNPDKDDLPFFTDDGNEFVPIWMAEHLMEDYNFATHEVTEEIYYYDGGIYKENGKSLVKKAAQRRLGQYVKNHYINETLEAVRRANYVPREKFNDPDDGIVVENGVLDVESRELENHSPEYVHLTKIPWKYNPDADCPRIKEFISELVNEDDVKLIQEMFGYCLYKDYPFAKAFMLIGSGANGKSTLMKLLEEFLGEDNIATPSLQDLLRDKFAKVELFGKLANIHADLSSEKLENTGTFKMLTGGDTVYGQKKFKDPIKFKNHAKLIYSANELPRTDDRTDAFFRRWIVIDFPNQFTSNDESTDPDLPHSIIDEEEMSGLLNWSLDGLERILDQGGFSETESRKEIERKWIMKTDSLRAFLDVACRDKRGAYVAKKDLYEVYKLFCDENNIYTVKKGQVTRRLPTIKPKVQLYRPELEGERVRCWKNLEIKKSFIKGKKYVQDVQPLRTTSIACEGKGSNKGSQKRLDISDGEKTFEMVSSSEDLKCCNHRDRQAVAKTEDHYDSNKKVGLCEECLEESNPDLFLWKSLAEKLEDLGAGVTGSHVSVDTLLRDFECDKTKAQEVIEKQLERGILEENPKNGKIKIRQRR